MFRGRELMVKIVFSMDKVLNLFWKYNIYIYLLDKGRIGNISSKNL